MTTRDDILALIPLHALGALDDAEAARVEEAVAADPALRAELDAHREAAAAIGDGLAAVEPSPALRARLIASVDATVAPGRFDRFAARVAEIFDVTVDKARMFLGWIDQPARWEATALPWVQQCHLPAGPAWAGADCGLVRMPAGSEFPWHTHEGEELTLVLSGRAKDSGGHDLGPGSEMVMNAEAQHDFVADPDSGEYIFAVRFHGIRPLPKPGP
jgi:anti-sigma factor ChrR (cupin superfamily)